MNQITIASQKRGALIAIVLLFVLLIVLVNCQISQTSGSLIIDEIIITSGLDGFGNPYSYMDRFSPNQEKIICFVRLTIQEPFTVGIRWYFENTLIHIEEAVVESQKIFVLEPDSPNSFQPGEYKIEIYFTRKEVQTLYFHVE